MTSSPTGTPAYHKRIKTPRLVASRALVPSPAGNTAIDRAMVATPQVATSMRGSLADAFANRAVVALSVLVLVMSLAVRLITWRSLLPQIDEPATLLAIEMVRQKGIPLFPSDVLYLQGALISYLGAPFAFLYTGSELLHGLQVLNLLASLSVIIIGFLVCFRVTTSVYASLFAAATIALDPTMLIWSIYIRPYGLLTLFTSAIIYCFVVIVEEGADARIWRLPARYALVVLFWLATFTHIAVWLIFPSMLFVAFMIWGTGLFKQHQQASLTVAGVMAVAAPMLVTAAGSVIGVGSSTSTAEGGAGFVGDHVLDLGRILEPQFTLRIWENTFIGSQLTQLMPYYVLGLLGVLFGMYINVTDRVTLFERRLVYTLLVLFIGPILTIAMLTSVGSQSRYIVHFLPTGYVLVAIAIWKIARESPSRKLVAEVSVRGLAVFMLILPMIVFAVQGARWRMEYAEDDPDFFPAMAYVGDNWRPGEIVLVSLPPVA